MSSGHKNNYKKKNKRIKEEYYKIFIIFKTKNIMRIKK